MPAHPARKPLTAPMPQQQRTSSCHSEFEFISDFVRQLQKSPLRCAKGASDLEEGSFLALFAPSRGDSGVLQAPLGFRISDFAFVGLLFLALSSPVLYVSEWQSG